MNSDTLILKIAEGFYDAAKENNKVSAYQSELKFLMWTFRKNPELFEYFKSTFNDYNDKIKTLDNIYEDTLSNEMKTFIKILLQRDLIDKIEEIKIDFDKLADLEANKIEGIIYTPFEIKEDRVKKMEEIFSKKLNKKVTLITKIDRSLVAGIRVLIKDIVYDYSLDSRLNDAKANLLESIK